MAAQGGQKVPGGAGALLPDEGYEEFVHGPRATSAPDVSTGGGGSRSKEGGVIGSLGEFAPVQDPDAPTFASDMRAGGTRAGGTGNSSGGGEQVEPALDEAERRSLENLATETEDLVKELKHTRDELLGHVKMSK